MALLALTETNLGHPRHEGRVRIRRGDPEDLS